MATRKDVAERACVSVAVVSYVLNNKANVKAETRKKVLQAIEELEYRPNLLARSLKTKKSRQLAVLVNNLGNPFEAGILLKLESEAKKAGYFIFFQTYQEGQDQELQTLFMGRVDGVILFGQSLATASIEHFLKYSIPVISVTKPVIGHPNVPYIDVEWTTELRRLIRHLKQLGHRKIAFMKNSNARHYHAIRYEAFLEALRLEELDFSPQLLLEGDGRYETGYSVMKRILSDRKDSNDLPYSSMICANDLMAVGALAACRELELSVPGDLALAGCENILMSSNTHPKLTTIHCPREKMGEMAVEMLLHMMAGEQAHSLILNGELLIRASTTPVI